MQKIDFVFADRATVPGWLGSNCRAEVLQRVLDVKPDRILLVTDKTVDDLHGDYFAPLYRGETGQSPDEAKDEGIPPLEKIVLPCGDACKSWACLTELMEWAFKVGATKSTLVLAFGGGALINVTGLFASMLYRGSKVIYVPTTLLAMHDVTTSLKTSICFDGRKNNIGTFYAPLKILIDTTFCKTLPRGELFSGIGELAKNAALLGGEHARGFTEALSSDSINGAHGGSGEEFTLEDVVLERLLALGIEAKMSVLATDAYEKMSGMIFEYGHTVSHAIEKAYGDGTIPHGLGVTYGMLSSSYAAEQMGIMSAEHRAEHDALCRLLLHRWPLPKPMPSAALVLALAMRDSKRGLTGESDEEVSDVLLRKMGDIVETKTNNLSKYPAPLLHDWLLQAGFSPKGDLLKTFLEVGAPIALCTPKACIPRVKKNGYA